MSENKQQWPTPVQYMKIQRKRMPKLRMRLSDAVKECKPSAVANVVKEKRNNPFAKHSDQEVKRVKTRFTPIKSKGTIFDEIHNKDNKVAANLEAPLTSPRKCVRDLNTVSFLDDDDDQASDAELTKPMKDLPIDWSIKSRMRIVCRTQIVNNTLKSTQEASGLTGFVRCIDPSSAKTNLDSSNESKFYQNLMYWQYPNFPWLNLVQRNASSNNKFKLNEEESEHLLKDWMICFKNLFQLLKANQCAYFYVLGNNFSVLFRAAGIGGIEEMHAFLTPSTRGFRSMLRDEGIDYTQPLKKTTKDEATPNTSLEQQAAVADDEEEDEDELKFLESLGVQTSDINVKEDIKTKQKEIEDDNGDLSTALIEGVDCQAFFNFLLNAKSTVPQIGRLAGIPPTLLSPVAFLGSSLKQMTTRHSKIRNENEDFSSIEICGALLPHSIHSICNFLSKIKESYSLTMKNFIHTVAFTKASRKIIEDLTTLRATGEQCKLVGEVKLSECGIGSKIVENMCRLDDDAINIYERIKFDEKVGGFTMF